MKTALPRLFSALSRRNLSTSIAFEQYGDPEKVLKLCKGEEEFAMPKDGEVSFQMLTSPINPADINMIQGTYGMKASFPAIAGNEGVGKITGVGPSASPEIKIGDHFVPKTAFWGTWRSHGVCSARSVRVVPNDISPTAMSMLFVNPPTAYKMLDDFETLNEGDVVIQNGSNSGVGQAVIQIAAARKLKTINVVRDRPDLDKLTEYLKSLGATEVVTEEFSQSREMVDLVQKVGKPKLALNGVGGKSATALMKQLQRCSTMVTYGGMSRQPVTVGTGMLIFNDVTLRGFWMGKWRELNPDCPAELEMYDDLYEMVRRDVLKMPPHKSWALDDFKTAVQRAWEPMTTLKQVFLCS
eukprot:m.126063 g.126063  ORF g.126063 m.126063 type:complete len:354 (+) comp37889_c0_seq25:22-1083(+)